MAVTAADVIKVAKAEVGTHETRAGGHWVNDSKYNHWYGKIPGYARGGMDYPWCAVFVAWVAAEAGNASLYPKTAGCATAVAWFKRAGRFSEYPAVGAQVFYGSGGGAHTGLVYAYDATYIYTVEGNTNTNGSAEGDGVYLHKRARRDSYVYGYGYPAFAEGIKSADPAWAKEAPKTPTKPATPATSKPPTTKPKVSVAHLNAARAKDIPAKTGHTTYPAEVRIVEAALVAEGCMSKTYAADGSWGTTTDAGFNAFRRKVGYTGSDATGTVGLASLKKLAARHGFTATT